MLEKGTKKEKVGGDAHIAPPKQHLRSVLSSAATPKPSGGIRSLPSLSACGLPTPVVAFACICDVDIRVLSGAGCQLYFYGVCKFICLSSFMYNRFHKELRFFFFY